QRCDGRAGLRTARDDAVANRTRNLVDDDGHDDDDGEGDADALPVTHVEHPTEQGADSAGTDHAENRARTNVDLEPVEPERDDLRCHLRPDAPAQNLDRAS